VPSLDVLSEQFEAAKQTAESLNLQLHSVKLENSPYDFEAAFRAMTDAQMLLVLSSYLFSSSRSRIAELAIRQRLPTMTSFKPYAQAGGLMAFSADIPPIYRRAASFVAKILAGLKAEPSQSSIAGQRDTGSASLKSRPSSSC
jgi:putative ABC transport system substrate-binding protein